jgi:hypothetical protein
MGTEERDKMVDKGMQPTYPRLQQGSNIANKPPTNRGNLVTRPTHFGMVPIPAAWSQENQLPGSTAAPQKYLCNKEAAEPTLSS